MTTSSRLDDIPYYYGEICELKTAPGTSPRWFDLSEGSNCVRCAEFFRAPPRGKKRHKMWLSPRGSAKSTIMAAEAKRIIQKDSEARLTYVSESEDLVLKRPRWIKSRLELEAKKMGWQSPKTAKWADGGFTVKRTSGLGFDLTLQAGSMEKGDTGSHWRVACLDDVVGRVTNRSARMRRQTIEFFEDLIAQCLNDSVIWIVGTMWPKHQLYREIIQHHKDEFDIVILSTHDEQGKMTYPWYTDEYLDHEKKLMRSPHKYKAQFNNIVVDEEDELFVPEHVDYAPLPEGLAVNYYMVTDLGTSQTQMRHTSQTALLLVGVTCTDDIWLLDGYVGKGNIEVSANHWIDILARAKSRDQYPAAFTIELQGPASGAWAYFQDRVKQAGLPPIARIPLNRSHTEKDSRIQMLYPYLKSGKVHVDPRSFPPVLFRLADDGMARGVIPDSMNRYIPGDLDESFDDLDAMSDTVLIYKNGAPVLFRPAPIPEAVKPPSAYERAHSQAMRKVRGDGRKWLR